MKFLQMTLNFTDDFTIKTGHFIFTDKFIFTNDFIVTTDFSNL